MEYQCKNQKEQNQKEEKRRRPTKNPQEIKKKNESFEQLISTESLKIESPQNKPEKRTKYIKTAPQIAKNGNPKDTKAKEQAQAEKANK